MRFVPPIPCWLVAAACLGCAGESTESPVAASDPAVAAVCAGRPASGAQDGDVCAHPWSYVAAGLEATRAPDCGGHPSDPLPCGRCDGSVPICAVAHTRDCPGVPRDPASISPLDAWLCACCDGAWTCEVQAAAASICIPEGGLPDGAESERTP